MNEHAREIRGALVTGIDLRIKTYPDGFRQQEHSHPSSVFNIVLSGVIEEETGDARFMTDTWGIYARPGGLAHSNAYRNGLTRVLSIRFDRDVRERTIRHTTGERVDARTMRRIVALLRDARARTAPSAVRAAVEDVLVPCLAAQRESRSSDAMHLVANRPAIRDAAVAANMHPVSFARRFRHEHGVAPSVWRRLNRVRIAAGMIAQDVPLSSVAHEAGFSDQSHMCRDFRNLLCITPAEYRRLIRCQEESATS